MSFIDPALRSLLEQSIQYIKRDPTYRLDHEFATRAMLEVAWARFVSILRAWRWYFSLRESGGLLFVGKHVTIRHPQYLSVGRGVTLHDYVTIDALSREGVIFGNNVSVGAFTLIEATGILRQLGKGFSIGNNSNLGDYCFVGAAGGVRIGENVIIGQRISFHSENHIFERTDLPIKAQGTTQQGIIVEDDCWLGAGVIILDGVTVHSGAVVAAGSVIAQDVPPYAIVGGVPAKMIRSRQPTTS
jgi:acetyltransferase-like isoleucine patch superfamily enzyme